MKIPILVVALALLLESALQASQPNVVIFLADDAGWGDYSFSGNKQVHTPNIDSIARGGVSLERFYVCPVCSPTRAEFLTGRYHLRGGVRGVSTGQERLDLDEKTLADAFKAAGYATGAFGKWHNGSQWPYHPMARGFDEYFGYSAGHWGEYFDPPLEENGRMIRTSGYIVDVCTDRAMGFIDRNKNKPFFCFVPFTTPHSPWAVPSPDWERFKDKSIAQTATDPRREALDETRCALAMLENQDTNVGRILSKLTEHQLEDNTLILYFSDNGPNSFRWTGGMKGKKGSTDEGGVRSVCYLKWPAKLPAGHRVDQISAAIDLLPTLTGLTQIQRVGDKPLDGRDLTPLLLKTTQVLNPEQPIVWPDRMIYSTWSGAVSVRTQSHRLDSAGKLFDMRTDPGQTQPINDREPAIAAQLQESVKSWQKEMQAISEQKRRERPIPKMIGTAFGVDERPIPVGYREFPSAMLPARDGEPGGGVQRSGSAPNCSYFVNWSTKEDSMVWFLDVHQAGTYEVTIDYTCKIPDVGSTIELSFQDARLNGKVVQGWDPPLYSNQDTLPRPNGESKMKEFKTMKLGEIAMPAVKGLLTLRAIDIPGKTVMDVRRITLTLLP